MTIHQRPIVCIVAVEVDRSPLRILLQRRAKEDDDTPYHSFWELPQGKVQENESLNAAARRELIEETGLAITGFIAGKETAFAASSKFSKLYVHRPIICVVDVIQNHFALAVITTVSGRLRSTNEARCHSWFPLEQVATIIKNNELFPLDVPIVEECTRVLMADSPIRPIPGNTGGSSSGDVTS